MAASSTFFGGHQPARSISLPSRIDASDSPRYGAIIDKLNSFRLSLSLSFSTAAPLRAEAIQTGLVGLAELYHRMEELVHSPFTQRSLLHHQEGKVVQEFLHGSVVLLDSCGCARDSMLAMREHVLNLQSALRRKGAHSSTENLIHLYISCRKRVQKDVAKCIQQLKQMEAKIPSPLPDSDHHLSSLIKLLREASSLAISVLKSLLVFLSMPIVRNKVGKWDLISQVMLKRLKSVETKGSEVRNDVVSVDVSLSSIQLGCRESMADQVQMAQTTLGKLDISLHGLEAELERVLRSIVQHRVSFLNILAH